MDLQLQATLEGIPVMKAQVPVKKKNQIGHHMYMCGFSHRERVATNQQEVAETRWLRIAWQPWLLATSHDSMSWN